MALFHQTLDEWMEPNVHTLGPTHSSSMRWINCHMTSFIPSDTRRMDGAVSTPYPIHHYIGIIALLHYWAGWGGLEIYFSSSPVPKFGRRTRYDFQPCTHCQRHLDNKNKTTSHTCSNKTRVTRWPQKKKLPKNTKSPTLTPPKSKINVHPTVNLQASCPCYNATQLKMI